MAVSKHVFRRLPNFPQINRCLSPYLGDSIYTRQFYTLKEVCSSKPSKLAPRSSGVDLLTRLQSVQSASFVTDSDRDGHRPQIVNDWGLHSTHSSSTTVPPGLRSGKQHRGDNGQQDSGSGRSGHIAMPTALFAISFFSKKKDEVQEAMDKLKDVDELEMFLRRAKLCEMKKEMGEAAEFYHQALSLLNFRKQEKVWEEPRILEAQVHIYDNMANLALSRGRLKEAESLYKETVKGLLMMGKEQDDNGIVEISLKLAMIYAMQQKYKESDAGYHFCMNTMEQKIAALKPVDDNTLALYGMCVNSYSRFLIINDKLKEAEAALKKTIDIAIRALSKEHEQVAVLYCDLATVATMQGKHAAAKDYINKSVDIGEKTKSSDLATFLCNKGLICMDLEEFAEGEKCCTRALQIAKKEKDKETEEEAAQCLKDIKEKKNEKKK